MLGDVAFNSKIEQVLIDRLQIAVVERLRHDYPMVAENLTVEKLPAYFDEQVSYAFTSFLANVHKSNKQKVTLYRYPATAWDFIKEKYAPQWVLERWPVRYESREVVTWSEKNFMCPHLETADKYPHAIWLRDGEDIYAERRKFAEALADMAKWNYPPHPSVHTDFGRAQ